ncbi:MAG: recombinase [Pirellula sp.]|nr:recombinase [Pirellula sp.]
MTNFVIAPDVAKEMRDVFRWYELQRSGLGDEFLTELDRGIDAIRRTPAAYLRCYGSFRRFKLARFPYVVFYEWSGEVVYVFGIFHTSRDPGAWPRTLRKRRKDI